MKELLYNIYQAPRIAFDFGKILLHCLNKTHLNLKGEQHHLCKVTSHDGNISEKYYYCTCGYMQDELPDNFKDYASLISKITKG